MSKKGSVFKDADGRLYLVRCPICKRENWAPAVATGGDAAGAGIRRGRSQKMSNISNIIAIRCGGVFSAGRVDLESMRKRITAI